MAFKNVSCETLRKEEKNEGKKDERRKTDEVQGGNFENMGFKTFLAPVHSNELLQKNKTTNNM